MSTNRGKPRNPIYVAGVATLLLLSGCYDFDNPYEQGCSALTEQVVYQESFDSYGAGVSASSIGMVQNLIGGGPAELSTEVANVPSVTDKSLAFVDSTGSGYLDVEVDLVAPMTGCARFAFEIRELTSGAEPTIIVADSTATAAIRLKITGSRDVQYDDGGFVTAGSLGGSTTAFYELRIDADLSAGTYDLFLDGAQIVSSAPMVAPIDNLDRLLFRTDELASGLTYIDALRAAELRAQ